MAVVEADNAPLPSQLDPAEFVRLFFSVGISILACVGWKLGGNDEPEELGAGAYAR